MKIYKIYFYHKFGYCDTSDEFVAYNTKQAINKFYENTQKSNLI